MHAWHCNKCGEILGSNDIIVSVDSGLLYFTCNICDNISAPVDLEGTELPAPIDELYIQTGFAEFYNEEEE